MGSAAITPWNLLTATAALLAFLIGLYTLVGRERKSPYLINSVFVIFLICTLGALLDIISLFVAEWQKYVTYGGAALLLIALGLTCWRVYKIYMRFALFVDSPHPKQWWFFRKVKDVARGMRQAKLYEHNPVCIPQDLQDEIVTILKAVGAVEERPDLQCQSAAVALQHQGQANKILAQIASAFLRKDYAVQYMAVSRHPIEFIQYLKRELASNQPDTTWAKTAARIIVVDAYTKHFGFTDSIYFNATRTLKAELGVTYITSSESYAGLHTASSEAFHAIQASATSCAREPVLVIYEDCSALVDLESSEQYRVFIRHVLPSERAWGGMFTVFAETAQPEQDWNLLNSYVSIALDFRTKSEES